MGKLIGYARVSTKQQSTDRQEAVSWPPASVTTTATSTATGQGVELPVVSRNSCRIRHEFGSVVPAMTRTVSMCALIGRHA